MKVSTIEITGARQDIASTSRALAVGYMQGDYMGILSRSNIFLYPKSKIIKDLMDKFVDIDSISINRVSLSSINIKIDQKIPTSVICNSVPDNFDVSQNSHCFFADKNGLIFDNTDSHVDSLPKIFVQDSTTTDMIGTKPIDFSRYNSLIDFYKKVEDSKIVVQGLLISESGDEMYIENVADTTKDPSNVVVVYFTERDSLSDTLTNLISFWNHMKSDSVPHSFSDIKLQFPPNIYYTETK